MDRAVTTLLYHHGKSHISCPANRECEVRSKVGLDIEVASYGEMYFEHVRSYALLRVIARPAITNQAQRHKMNSESYNGQI